jgi:hypothetical protein
MFGWLRRLFGRSAPKSGNAWILKREMADPLMEQTGLRNERDLINNAMSLLEWVGRALENEWIVALVDETRGIYQEVKMPWAEYPKRLLRVRNLIEDGIEDELTTVSALEEEAWEYLTVMW